MPRPLIVLPILILAMAATACGEHPASAGIASAVDGPGVLSDPATGADCGGKDLHITRDNSRLVIHGQCREVVISASNGALNLDHARTIRVQGTRFTVLNADVALVEVAGNGNTLNLTRAGRVSIGGDDNLVLGRELGSVAFGGKGNTVNTDNTPELDDRGSGNRVI